MTLASLTPEEIRRQLRCAAGVHNVKVPVRIVDHARALPPTLRRMRERGKSSHRREVVVSVKWLVVKRPRIWAALMAARLLGQEVEITALKED